MFVAVGNYKKASSSLPTLSSFEAFISDFNHVCRSGVSFEVGDKDGEDDESDRGRERQRHERRDECGEEKME